MTTITLPDNISFEEIALKWCDLNSNNAIRYIAFDYYRFMKYEDADFRGNEVIAEFCPHDRELLIDDFHYEKGNFDPVLDYIKERSNG